MCMLYGTTLENDRCAPYQTSNNMSHIKCSVYDGDWNYGKNYCRIEWRPLQQEFQITVNNVHDNASLIRSTGNQFETTLLPIFGKLECEIKDTDYSLNTYTYEEPFLIGPLNGLQYDSNGTNNVPSIYYFLPIILFLLITIVLCFGILKYRAQSRKEGILQEWR